MADSDSDYDEDYVMYKNRADWNDVVPVAQDDGPNPIVSIRYTERFRDVFDYFRAVLKSGEKSDRVLQLTSDAARNNPASYTVWQYRRDVLRHLNADLSEELDYISEAIRRHPKNYQVWHHRKIIVEWLNDPSKELKFTEEILNDDSKNYHAWQHRQWVIATFKLYDKEMEYIDTLLECDIRNNSAWNQLHFVILRTTGFTPAVIERELNKTMERIRKAVNNESAWNYLRGVLVHTETGNISAEQSVCTFCQELYESGNRSPHLLAFLVDVCEETLDLGTCNDTFNEKRAIEICELLATEHDKIRREYWEFISRKLKQRTVDKATVPEAS